MVSAAWQLWLVIGVCGAPTAIGAWLLTIRYDIDHQAFRGFVLKVLDERDRDRLDKVLRAVQPALLAELVGAALALDLPRLDPDARAEGYRRGQAGRSYEQRLREALAPTLAELRGRLIRAWSATLPGLLPLPLLLFDDPWPWTEGWPLLCAGVLALVTLGCTSRRRKISRSFDLALSELAPLLEDGCHRRSDAAP